jgi:hypothetical protein
MDPQDQQLNNSTQNPQDLQNTSNSQPSPKKDKIKKILIAVILALLIAVGAVAYLWQSQTKELKQNIELDTQKIQELESKLEQAKDDSGNENDTSSSYLKVPEWDIMFELNTKDPSYIIGGLGEDVSLWLTNKASKDTIKNGCDEGDNFKLYPASIKRYSAQETVPNEVKEFYEELGIIDGYSYYLGFGKEACSTDPQEANYRLEVYNMAKTIQKLQ